MSSLSELSSSYKSESEDLVVNQPITKPKNRGQVNRDRRIPIATTSATNKRNKNLRRKIAIFNYLSYLFLLSSPLSSALNKS
ncbi:hypothetical protein H4Q26_001173 [Puccinia striiformis f. sp. tritici PST-130]|nr:hypothetical protein H4Q26_001173 [Puccinia striiformis f. sp. tritici PST-130]